VNSLSLSSRITLLLGAAAIVLLGGAALVMDRMVDTEINQRMDASLVSQAQTLASLASIGPNGLDIEHARKPPPHLLAGRTAAYWSVHCANGDVAISDPPPPTYPTNWRDMTRAQPVFADIGGADRTLRAVWFRFEANDIDNATTHHSSNVMVPCSVLFMHSRRAMDDILSVIDDILLSIPLLALLAVLLLSPVLVRRGLKPLAILTESMRDIGPHAPGQRLQGRGTRELEPLTTRFNEVLTRMDEGVARERQFAGALAHETRTHLAELRSLVEVEQRYPSRRALHEVLGEAGQIVGELQDTVSGLLLLTRLEADLEGMNPIRVALSDALDKQLQTNAGLVRKRRLQVRQANAQNRVTLMVDHALLDIILGNLVNNALAYAPAGSCIDICWQTHSLVIINDAPDVEADDVSRFGQRFWSKHHGIAGHAGLGLALAGAAASSMHLRLRFDLDQRQRLHTALSWPDRLEIT